MTGLFLSLLRKDPALKGTLTGLPLAIGFGLLFRWGAGDSMASLAGPDWPGIALFLFTVVWGFALWFLAFTGFWTRGHRLYVSLPISGRTLWFTRMTAVVLSIFLPACGFLLVLAFRTAGGGALTALGLKMVGALLLLVMIGQNPYPKLRVVPVQAPYLVFMVFLGILTLFYLRLTPSSILFVLLPLAGAVAVGVQTWLQIPTGFLLAPDRHGLSDGSPWWNGLAPVGEMEPAAATEENENAESTETSEATEVDDRSGASATEEPSEPEATFRQVLHRTLYRTLLHRFGVWMILLGLLFIAYIQTWELFSGPGNWLMLIYVAGWVIGYFYRSRSWIRNLDPLPISRKRIFLYVAGALPIPILIGALLASLFTAAGHASLVTLKDRREVQLEIPYEFWRFAEAGEQPKATAPWGESLELPTYRIGPWTPRSLYNPYAVDKTSSRRFVDWQTNRAVREINGANSSRLSPVHTRVWLVELLGSGLLLLALLVLVFLKNRSALLRFLARFSLPALGTLVILVIAWMILGPVRGLTTLQASEAYPLVLCRMGAEKIPVSNTWLAWLLCLLVPAGYFLLQYLFMKVEPDRTPAKTPWRYFRF